MATFDKYTALEIKEIKKGYRRKAYLKTLQNKLKVFVKIVTNSSYIEKKKKKESFALLNVVLENNGIIIKRK